MAVAFRVEEIDTFGFGFEQNQSGSVKERKESTTVDGVMAVAMSVGATLEPFDHGVGEREGLGNQFDKEVMGWFSLT